MLSLMGGLWVMSGTASLAAGTTASASRSFSSASVAPGGNLMVTIDATGYGGFAGVTETLPAGFTYVSNIGADRVTETGRDVRFSLQGADKSFTYVVTASRVEDTYTFSGTLRDDDRDDHTVGGATSVTVGTVTVPTTPVPTATLPRQMSRHLPLAWRIAASLPQ